MGSTEHAPRSLQADVWASAAVTVFSITVAAGFARVFSGWEYMADFVRIIIAGHGIGLVLRRFRVPGVAAIPIAALVLTWVLAALYYRDTFSWGLPTGDTWSLFEVEVTGVRDQFAAAVAPVIYGAGWEVLAGIGMATAVALADAFAFRAYARAETLVPGGVLFVFVGALGNDRDRVALTIALVAAGVLTTVVLRAYHALDRERTGRPYSPRLSIPAALACTAVVAFGAGYLGPRLPGATADALYDTGSGGGGVTTVVNPLVDIRSRLTNRSDVELFRVRADQEAYWRSSALAEFDGTSWTLPEQPLESGGPAPSATTRGGGIINEQEVTIAALGGSLIPAAADPIDAEPTTEVSWSAATSTLVKADDELASGDVFDIVSQAPVLDAELLQGATSDQPPSDSFMELPDDFPESVTSTAREVTAGADSPYAAARALQSWFREEFDYSLDVQPGHGNNAIESFLRERVGYCEQFAGTYAAMMRSLGHPARVAVGFTSGILAEDGRYSVRGRNAHAWPEVWFDDIGWVAFEPTPGRGAPNAEAYTGVAPEQDLTPPPPATETNGAGAATTSTLPTPVVDPADALAEEFPTPTETDPVVDTTPAEEANRLPVIIVLLGVLLLLLPMIVRRLRFHIGAPTPEAKLGRMWAASVETVRAEGVPLKLTDTPLEAAATTAEHLPSIAPPFTDLARVVTAATYSPDGLGGLDTDESRSGIVRRCRFLTRQISRTVNDAATPIQRIRHYFTFRH